MKSNGKKANQYLGFGFLGAGACFLFDPFVSVFDVLPDWIGYLLILHGLSRLACLDGYVEQACRQFRRLLMLSAARFVSVFAVFGLTSANEHGVALLLCTFGLAVLDICVLIPAWNELGKGLSLLAALHNGTAALASTGRGDRETSYSITDRMVSITLVFLCVKEALALLPELSVLFSTVGGAEGGGLWNSLYQYIGLFRGMCALAALVLGIVWLCRMLRYGKALREDDVFFSSLGEAYDSYVQLHPGLYHKRNIRRAVLWLSLGVFLMVDFYADGINLLPDVLAAVCFLIAMWTFRKQANSVKPIVVGLAVFIPVSLLVSVWQSYILHDLAISGGSRFTFMENAARLTRDPDSLRSFYLMCAALFVAQLILACVLFGMYRILCGVIDRHAGLSATVASDCVGSAHTDLKKRLLAVTAYGMACEAFSIIYMVTLPYALNTAMELFGFLDIILHIVYGILFVYETRKILQEIA